MVISNNVKILDTETGAYVSPEELLGDTNFKAAVLDQDFVIIKSKNYLWKTHFIVKVVKILFLNLII